MSPDQRDLLVFHHVALHMSFTQAAESLNVSKGHVSKSINRLESLLNIKLFHRTTRTLVLTESGEKLAETTKEMQETLSSGLEALQKIRGAPTGRLRVSAPPALSEAVLSPMFAKFMKKYPEVTIDLALESRLIDLISEDYDVMFRSAELADSSFIARHLFDIDYCVVASPKFLKDYSEPKKPEDLSELPCIAYKRTSHILWSFQQGKISRDIKIEPKLSCNLSSFLKEGALNGTGVTVIPRFMVEEALSANQLKVLLPEWQLKNIPLYLVYPSRKHIPLKLRCFIDFVCDYGYSGVINNRF